MALVVLKNKDVSTLCNDSLKMTLGETSPLVT